MLATLGIELPIIQAPMAGVSTPALAAAVSNAGALGSLGIGASSVAEARSMIDATRAKTALPFNVNVFCHEPARRDAKVEARWTAHLAPLFDEFGLEIPSALAEIYPSFIADEEAFRMLLEARPAVVSFHFGLPSRHKIDAFREAGIKTMATATSLQEATVIERAGIDVIVAQGVEAGGHRGLFDPAGDDEGLTTSVLVRLLVQKLPTPVVAAGGIMDGKGIRAAIDLGAVGAQLGTAFILCPESAANQAYRAALKSDRAAFTRLTSVISGRPARGLLNRFMEHGEQLGSPPPAAYPVAYDLAKRLNAGATKVGNSDFAAQWAGQGGALAREHPAGELIKLLAAELCPPVPGFSLGS